MQLLHDVQRGSADGAAGSVPHQLHGLPGQDQCGAEHAGQEVPSHTAAGEGGGGSVGGWARSSLSPPFSSVWFIDLINPFVPASTVYTANRFLREYNVCCRCPEVLVPPSVFT